MDPGGAVGTIHRLNQHAPSCGVNAANRDERSLHANEAVPRLLTLVNDDRKSRFGALVTVSEAAKAAIAKLQ